MLTTAVIAFREFLEAFLIVGVFLGVSKKLNLKKEREIMLATGIGIALALSLASGTYLFGNLVGKFLTEKNADILEGFILIFSGLFIGYVIFSLHNSFHKNRQNLLMKAQQQMRNGVFDVSIFLTVVFLVVREGFEIALFTSTISLFSVFIQNFLGLLIGFTVSSIIGISTYFAYLKLPVAKVLKSTEYMIMILGAALIQNGITKLLALYFNIRLSDLFSLNLRFLPDSDSVWGHLIKNLVGLDKEMSVARLSIMGIYIAVLYLAFLNRKALVTFFKRTYQLIYFLYNFIR